MKNSLWRLGKVRPGLAQGPGRLLKKASSGKVTRVRLDRGGDRQANSALWVIVMARMSADKATRAYVERRVAEGRSKLEVIRVLKRYVARELYRYLPRA